MTVRSRMHLHGSSRFAFHGTVIIRTRAPKWARLPGRRSCAYLPEGSMSRTPRGASNPASQNPLLSLSSDWSYSCAHRIPQHLVSRNGVTMDELVGKLSSRRQRVVLDRAK